MWILPNNYPLSSAFVADMVESSEDLTLPDLNIESSLMWRSKPSAVKTWQRRWKTSSWMPRLYGRILKPSQHMSFETKLTYLPVAILANHFPQQDNEKEQTTHDTCGPTSKNTSEQFDLFGSSLRTSKVTSVLDCEKSLAIWKASVISRRGEYSVRLKSALHTVGSESTSWPTVRVSSANGASQKEIAEGNPKRRLETEVQLEKWLTPVVQDSKHSGVNPGPNGKRDLLANQVNWATPRAADSAGGPRTLNEKGQRVSVSDTTKTYGANLSDQVRHWPTPSARDHKGGSGTIVEEGDKFYRVSNTTQTRFGARLDAVVEHLHKKDWPTPTVQDSNKATKKMRVDHQNNLTAIVFNAETLPTPTSRDYKGGYTEDSLTRKDGKSRRFDALPNAAIGGVGTDVVKGHLNPDWVEQLMGVPPGWTSLTGTNTKWTYGWSDGSWEEGIPRVVESVEDRVDRIRLLGNGVVPQTAAKAWQILGERL